MTKSILGLTLILLAALATLSIEVRADDAAFNADPQKCQIDAGWVDCLGGAQDYDLGCQVSCASDKRAVCIPASGYTEYPNDGSMRRCDLIPSSCTCE